MDLEKEKQAAEKVHCVTDVDRRTTKWQYALRTKEKGKHGGLRSNAGTAGEMDTMRMSAEARVVKGPANRVEKAVKPEGKRMS